MPHRKIKQKKVDRNGNEVLVSIDDGFVCDHSMLFHRLLLMLITCTVFVFENKGDSKEIMGSKYKGNQK